MSNFDAIPAGDTPASFAIKEYYRSKGIGPWSVSKFIRLANAMKITPVELGALVGVKPGRVIQIGMSASILCEILQSWYVAESTGTEPRPIMPIGELAQIKRHEQERVPSA